METTDRKSPITGKEGAEIAVNVAADWTRNHRHRQSDKTISQFFGFEILQRILQQPGCLGIRIYYANSKPLNGWQKFIISIANFLIKVLANAEGETHLVLTGVTAEGLDQIPTDGKLDVAENIQMFKSNAATAAGGASSPTLLAEQSMPCPGGAGCPKNVLTGN